MVKKGRKYFVIGSKPWNRQIFQDIISKYPGQWSFFNTLEPLTPTFLKKIKPTYLFFLHWSSLVPDEIISNYECVCFHMTDVPFGRGGSPLQNLIIRGHRCTKLTALKMTEHFDAGPVYFKEDLSLEGNAEEIYIKATLLAAKMIKRIIEQNPKPIAQSGKPTLFKRRRPEESEIPPAVTLMELHDFIRMLDADGYPKAFFVFKGFKFEFSRAALYNEKITADVTITRTEEVKK